MRLVPRAVIVAAASLWIAIVAAACSDSDLRPLRLSAHLWAGYEPLFLAAELGYYGDAPIKLIELPSATESLRAFENGSVDAAALTLDEVIRLKDRGTDVVAILVLDFSNGADALLANDRIASLADLKGHAIGVESTALGAYLLVRALESVGLSSEDISVASMPIEETETAYRTGTVDAVVTYEPYKSRLERIGARRLFDSSLIPGEIVDVLAVRAEVARDRPGVLHDLLEGHFRALAYLARNPEDAIRRMAERERIAPADFARSLASLKLPDRVENSRLFSATESALTQTVTHLSDYMTEHGLIHAEVAAKGLLDGQFIAGPGT